MSEVVLALKNVRKTFGKEKTLENICLEVKKGDIYGLIGRNGSGKTTIMKLITDLSEQTAGEVTLFGENKHTKEYSRILQRIGSVIETPVAFNNLSAYENMRIICIQRGIHDFSVIEETLDFINLKDIRKKKVKNFSLGMKQRLGIAMALVTTPDFLILDEPFNTLDPIATIEFREIIKRINHEKNTTILISSHILTELYNVSTRFGFIHNGKILQEVTKSVLASSNTEMIVVKVNDINKTAMLLKEHIDEGIEIVGQDEIHIFTTRKTVGEINRLLVINDVLVNYIGKKENSLENYYTDLVNTTKENGHCYV
ncbi:ABC transporter ATP-binding protein [Enterococcus sp. DIV0187]|uniref:ABC transporter ATP-binding protein n=1 Tax=Enterococcus sp. DIV0187 TaxID=2774644 RepID=UPI003F27A8E9